MTWYYDNESDRWVTGWDGSTQPPGSKPEQAPPPEAAAAIADAGIEGTEAGRIWRAMLRLMWAEFSKGNAVAWPGIGTFSPKWQAARTGRNPRTGAPCNIPACWRLRFRESGQMRKAIN